MTLVSINPFSGQELARYPQHNPQQIEQRLQCADRAFKRWSQYSFTQRSTPMLQLAQLLRAQRQSLAQLISSEMGKLQAEALTEIDKCATCCEHYADQTQALLRSQAIATDAHHSYLHYQPLGVILAVMPWNYPFWQVFRFLVPVLMAGNGALLKHARNVTGCAQKIEALVLEAGFPEGLFAQLQLPGATVEPIIGDPRISGVAITGSTQAGMRVAAAAGRALKPSVLELGGSDPFIVLADADLEQVIPQAIKARYSNAGQVCIAAKRFLVEQSLYPEFLEGFVAAAEILGYGDPQQSGTELAPMATEALRASLHQQVEQAVAGGARLELGGTFLDGPGFGYAPSVLSNVQPDNPVFAQELFGPVAQVLPFTRESQALDLANATPFGLGASVWSQNHVQAEALGRQLAAGAVFINSTVKSDLRLPFGGTKHSGYGRELAAEGLRSFCNLQSVWVQTTDS